ncbi:hypothetical protein GBA52_020491 [Prunus armeniaca]|nr:hypothetical protein GBA52_020491 [Prunus armeniaca]
MATLSCYSLHPLSSASSSSTTSLTANHSLPHQPQIKPEIPLLFRCSATIAARPEVIIQPTRLFVQPILLFAGFDKPLDTQTFLATISVLAAIALSLFLGLKGDPLPCERCAGNGDFLCNQLVVMAVKLVKRVFENGFGSIQGLPNWLLVAVIGPQNVQPF